MSVNEVTVRRVFDIDQVKQATFRSASADAPSDTHYREIARAPRVRDSVTGLREFESYAVPGQSERRWMRLSGMTAANLRAAMEQARTQERQLFRKGEGYHILLEELEKAGAGATVSDIMPQAMPRILDFRAKSA